MTFQALLFCPDEKTARVTTQVLTELEFSVEACSEPFAAVKKLMGEHFDAIVVDCDNEQNASLLFKSARNSASNQASLAVAVVEGQSGVANAFRIGANLVLTKPINVEQAKSTLRVARGLLRKGEAAKASAPASAPPSPAAPQTPKRPGAESAPPARAPLPPSSVAKPSATPAISSRPAVPNALAGPALEAARPVEAPEISVKAPVDDLFESPQAAGISPDHQDGEGLPLSQPTTLPSITRPHATMTTSLPRPAAEPDKKERQSISSTSPAAPTETPIKGAPPAFALSGFGASGAASAPAPAKETPKAHVPPTAFEAEQAIAPAVAPGRSSSSIAETTGAKSELRTPAVPSFGFPSDVARESAEELPSEGGAKKGILVAVAVLVLAVAGYFGYSKFFGATRAQTPPATTEQPANPVTEQSEPSAVVSTPAPNSASVPATTQPSSPKASATPAAPSASDKSGSFEESDVTVTHVDDSPRLVVKSGMVPKPTPKSEAGTEVAAPALGMSADESAISNLVQSTSPAVPRIASPPQTLKVSQGVTQGLLLKRVQPVYPQQALQMHIQGAVQLQATINQEGKITSVKILGGDPMLARAAVDAVNQWRYKPYYLNGDPVEIQTQIVVNFKLP